MREQPASSEFSLGEDPINLSRRRFLLASGSVAGFEKGQPVARNFDLYPILPASRMAQVEVRIIESGAKMGGIGEPPLPAVPPAVANAVSRLTGQRIRSMPLSRYNFT